MASPSSSSTCFSCGILLGSNECSGCALNDYFNHSNVDDLKLLVRFHGVGDIFKVRFLAASADGRAEFIRRRLDEARIWEGNKLGSCSLEIETLRRQVLEAQDGAIYSSRRVDELDLKLDTVTRQLNLFQSVSVKNRAAVAALIAEDEAAGLYQFDPVFAPDLAAMYAKIDAAAAADLTAFRAKIDAATEPEPAAVAAEPEPAAHCPVSTKVPEVPANADVLEIFDNNFCPSFTSSLDLST